MLLEIPEVSWDADGVVGKMNHEDRSGGGNVHIIKPPVLLVIAGGRHRTSKRRLVRRRHTNWSMQFFIRPQARFFVY
jgi:hypothetical protein